MSENETLYSDLHIKITEEDGLKVYYVTKKLLDNFGCLENIMLPFETQRYGKGEIFGFVESKKAGYELYNPLTCIIKKVNENLRDDPGMLDSGSCDKIWLIKVDADFYEVDKKDLLKEEDYLNNIPSLFP